MKINRRNFCQYAVTTSLSSALPATLLLTQGCASSQIMPSEIPAVTLDGRATSIEGVAARELGESLRGSLLLQGDFGYDGARSIWNGMHDRSPALIIRPTNALDVANAVTFARERELLLSVKGGGHSWPGHSVADKAIMIDLSAMRDVTLDVARRRARVGGGTLLGELDHAAQRHGLTTTAGVVSHTGVGGYTLGGGFGRLNRKFGLTIDNLVSAQLVTADGQVRRVAEDENPDLFWAVRGGGGNYGVVTEFEFSLHEVGPVVLGGDLLWPLDQARDLLNFYAEYSTGLSDEMYVAPYMTAMPDGAGIVGMDVCYCGDLATGESELAPLRTFGNVLSDGVAAVPYITLQTRFDGAWRPGVRSYVKGGMVGEFSPALIEAMIENFDPTGGVFMAFHTAGGEVARVAEDATAWPHRNAETMINAAAAWAAPADDDARIQATRALWSALEPHTGGYYDNIQSEVSSVGSNYGPVYDRLVSVKTAHDPMNLFRLNSNIRPVV